MRATRHRSLRHQTGCFFGCDRRPRNWTEVSVKGEIIVWAQPVEEELGLSESAMEMPSTVSENLHPNANLTKSFHSKVVDRKIVMLSMSMPKKTVQIPLGFEPASFAIARNSDLKMISPQINFHNLHCDNPLIELKAQSVIASVPDLCRAEWQVCTLPVLIIFYYFSSLSLFVYLSSELDIGPSRRPKSVWTG